MFINYNNSFQNLKFMPKKTYNFMISAKRIIAEKTNMKKFSVDKALLKAKSYAKKGKIEEAQKLYMIILHAFPKNNRAQKELDELNKFKKSNTTQDPLQNIVNHLVSLYNQGQLSTIVQTQAYTEQYPQAFFLWNILGAAYQELGKTFEASKAFKRATQINPYFADGFSNLGITLHELGKLGEAIEAYNNALTINPVLPAAYFNMGITLQQQCMLDKAVEAYKKAIKIKPDYADAYNNMGNAFKDQDNLEKAIVAYYKALEITPNYAAAYNNIGMVYHDQDKLEEALEAYKKAINIKSDYAAAYFNMGITFQKKDELERAIKAYDKALAIKPDYAEAYNNMGMVYHDKDKQEEAIKAFKNALAIKPDYASAYNNMGMAFQDQDKLKDAIESFDNALAIDPEYAEAYNNKGSTLQKQGKLKDAIEAYDNALAIKPDYAGAYYNSSFVYNLKGEIKKGLKLFEYRFKKQKALTRAPREKLYWNGLEPIKGKHFLVYEEQGLGDIIQFSRYLPALVKKGAAVTFMVTQKLHSLLRTMDSNIILVDTLPNEKHIDFEAPLMSLPFLLNTSLETIPSMETYLFADYTRVVSWGKLLNAKKFKIGICWQGSKNKIDIGRSFPLSKFEGISKLPNVDLISLHKGEGEKQVQDVQFNLTTLGSEFDAGQDAFLDTAAVIVNCDLIITSDTAIAHLAGSLGCKTWLILKHVPDWRWMLNRTDSPWYPSITLYRQKFPGNWDDVFTSIEKKLLSKLEERK